MQKHKIANFDFGFDANTVSLSRDYNEDRTKVIQMPLEEKLISLGKYGDQLYNDNEKELVVKSENNRILAHLVSINLGYHIIQDSISISSADAYIFLNLKNHVTEN